MSTSHPILGDEGDEVCAEVLEQSAKHTLLVYYDGVNWPIEIEIGDAAALRRLADRLHQIASYVDGGWARVPGCEYLTGGER